MQLIHRTNYYGKWIDSLSNDNEIDFCAIWAQAMDDYSGDCCRGFGRRRVRVVDSDFKNEYNGWWSLFLVTESQGENYPHYFYKFAAIPQFTPNYGKKGCQRRGWSYRGEFHSSNAVERLEELLQWELDMDDDYINHIHIGLWMDSLYAP